jgi:hypothetical protein
MTKAMISVMTVERGMTVVSGGVYTGDGVGVSGEAVAVAVGAEIVGLGECDGPGSTGSFWLPNVNRV